MQGKGAGGRGELAKKDTDTVCELTWLPLTCQSPFSDIGKKVWMTIDKILTMKLIRFFMYAQFCQVLYDVVFK